MPDFKEVENKAVESPVLSNLEVAEERELIDGDNSSEIGFGDVYLFSKYFTRDPVVQEV
jgi:hypothetical protein